MGAKFLNTITTINYQGIPKNSKPLNSQNTITNYTLPFGPNQS